MARSLRRGEAGVGRIRNLGQAFESTAPAPSNQPLLLPAPNEAPESVTQSGNELPVNVNNPGSAVRLPFFIFIHHSLTAVCLAP
ncbi:hypothetical protein CIHG_00373 [Coccidioides immitis H538.4]|uniref:Uncharacterized protein n=1 Tax=Coccidioides immitis H538.4 TaxID=396776 RepID=A0A0J8RCE3_COCIT|nr:hypothetical protein CIHG_00373 [Coccidioides immitis H538.4]